MSIAPPAGRTPGLLPSSVSLAQTKQTVAAHLSTGKFPPQVDLGSVSFRHVRSRHEAQAC